jgi:glycosyltransferase 2 family protein
MRAAGILYKILIYISLLFLAWFLWRFDYLSLKGIKLNYGWFSLSVAFLWAGFWLSAISWRFALWYHNIRIDNRTAVVSHGLSIFAKYIPGKIWVILGRASYVSRRGESLKETSFISLKEQLLYILLGLIISAIPSFWYFKLNYITISLLITCLVLALILFNRRVHQLAEILLGKLFRKEFQLPHLNLVLSGKLSVFIVFYWTAWILAFYSLNKAVIPDAGIINAFAFPLSVCYGVLAIIMPGGLGVREGIMVAFLTAAGMNTESAVSLSVIARLWFMTGEIFIFLMAFVLQKIVKKDSTEKV